MRSYARNQGAAVPYPTICEDIKANDDTELSKDTVLSYTNALRKIFVIEDCPAWSPNLRSKTGKCAFAENSKCIYNGKNTTIVPIYSDGDRIGTLVVAKYGEEFTDDDLLLAEYGATVVGMEMLRDHTKEVEIEAREKATVQIALSTLSYSEIEAAISIFGRNSHAERVATVLSE